MHFLCLAQDVAVRRIVSHPRFTSPSPVTTPTRSSRLLPGFAFDIDGVLIGNDAILEKGKAALRFVQGDNPRRQPFPFVLLTNGGSVTDADRLEPLSRQLDLRKPLRLHDLIQSHTPMRSHCKPYLEKPVYVVGGHGGAGRKIAKSLGFREIYTHEDFHSARPDIFPFRSSRPSSPSSDLSITSIPIGMVLIVHDSIDWGCDIQIMIDLLSSHNGRLDQPKDPFDTSSWQSSRQIPLFFSNGDILFANSFPRSRLGQGAFRTAFEAAFKAATGHDVHYTTFGKPTSITYDFALDRLQREANEMQAKLSNIYMIGDNPDSDIAGANAAGWRSILVRGGVYKGSGPPKHEPTTIQDDSYAGVQWALAQETSTDK